jgi:hypothetical protein
LHADFADLKFKNNGISHFDYTIANGFNRWRQYKGGNEVEKIGFEISYPRVKPWAMIEMLRNGVIGE